MSFFLKESMILIKGDHVVIANYLRRQILLAVTASGGVCYALKPVVRECNLLTAVRVKDILLLILLLFCISRRLCRTLGSFLARAR
jgi:hypothetical protein